MESNIENNLIENHNFLDKVNPKTLNDCKVEARKGDSLAYQGVLRMGKSFFIAKKICNGDRGKFSEWCKEVSYAEGYVNRIIRIYEIYMSNTDSMCNLIKENGINRINALISLCDYKMTYYKDNKKLSSPIIDTDTEGRRKFDTFHMDNFIEQNKDNLEDITLQDLKALVKEYKITNDLIKEKKQELKESEQKLIDTYKELETVSAETDKIKYVQSTIGNIVTSSNKLDILFEDDYRPIIQDVDMKKELEVNLIHIRDKINNLLNEINLEKYNYGNIIDIENYTTEG